VTFGVHPEDYEPFLARHGFRVIDLALASELAARYTPHVQAAVDDSMYVLAAERVGS
jgi:oligoribonuclease (3'-5' exoribonuclease)